MAKLRQRQQNPWTGAQLIMKVYAVAATVPSQTIISRQVRNIARRWLIVGYRDIFRAIQDNSREQVQLMRAAIKWGALIGVASYLLVGLGLTVLGVVAFGTGPASLDTSPGKLTLGCASLFLLLFAFSAAGFFAGRETVNAGMGAIAGMVAFAIYGVLITIYAPGSSANILAEDSAAPGGFVLQAMAIVVTVAVPLGIAALMGWLGGRPGAMRARKALRSEGGAVVIDAPDTVDAGASESQ